MITGSMVGNQNREEEGGEGEALALSLSVIGIFLCIVHGELPSPCTVHKKILKHHVLL